MFGAAPASVTLSADMRYTGQSHELEVPAGVAWEALVGRFHQAHNERFGFDRPGERVELVNQRAVATGPAPLTWDDLRPRLDGGEPEGESGVWRRGSLPPGLTLDGPAVVVEDNSATLLEDGDQLTVLDDGTLRIRFDS